ncbi:hypothetical protein OAF54_00890 [bacterium]|nr:hypothetical protein [bacterium]
MAFLKTGPSRSELMMAMQRARRRPERPVTGGLGEAIARMATQWVDTYSDKQSADRQVSEREASNAKDSGIFSKAIFDQTIAPTQSSPLSNMGATAQDLGGRVIQGGSGEAIQRAMNEGGSPELQSQLAQMYMQSRQQQKPQPFAELVDASRIGGKEGTQVEVQSVGAPFSQGGRVVDINTIGTAQTNIKLPTEERTGDFAKKYLSESAESVGEMKARNRGFTQRQDARTHIRDLLSNGNLSLGPLTEIGMSVYEGSKQLAGVLGVDFNSLGITEDFSEEQAFNALSKAAGIDAVSVFKGSTSNRELGVSFDTVVSLSKTKEGNMMILDFAEHKDNINRAQVLAADEWIKKNGEPRLNNLSDFEKHIEASKPDIPDHLRTRIKNYDEGIRDGDTASKTENGITVQLVYRNGQWVPIG